MVGSKTNAVNAQTRGIEQSPGAKPVFVTVCTFSLIYTLLRENVEYNQD
jgi:hypothetical protein